MSEDYLYQPPNPEVQADRTFADARWAIEAIRTADLLRDRGRQDDAVDERAKAAARLLEQAWAECEGSP